MARFICICVIVFVSICAKAEFPRPSVLKYQPQSRSVQMVLLEDGENESFWSRVTFGGNIGLQFGNPTNIILSPAIGYIPKAEFLKDKLMFGIGVTYMYNKTKYNGFTYESNIWGGRTFARYLIFDNIFAYTEYELLNSPPYYIDQESSRVWVSSLFFGGGYLLRFSNRGGIMITVLYNVAWTPLNPVYSSPWNFRVGFMF